MSEKLVAISFWHTFDIAMAIEDAETVVMLYSMLIG
jgi:hypothetical protein